MSEIKNTQEEKKYPELLQVIVQVGQSFFLEIITRTRCIIKRPPVH